jgi:hypothetical protein
MAGIHRQHDRARRLCGSRRSAALLFGGEAKWKNCEQYEGSELKTSSVHFTPHLLIVGFYGLADLVRVSEESPNQQIGKSPIERNPHRTKV